MQLVRSLQLALMAMVLGIAAGCAQLGLEAPESFRDKAAATLVGATTARTTATALLNAGKITVADAENVQKTADAVRDGVRVAQTLSLTDMTSAQAKLNTTRTILAGIVAYLNAKQAGA
jgi:predicted kinase